jgi:hypothetical protein
MAPKDEQRFIPGTRPRNDPQAELVRRYARILRSAPAEAWRPPRTASDGAMLSPRFRRAGRPDGPAAEL